ncbi:Rpn family recombination-promoting nuclease/putative transposase [Faecalibacillus faecis]|uniref:Rpn family recombination-promoting nuclease/putative transposase n=1 Tax=Faecalibacillus faecis TaxID=1982628 RepID=UPI0022E1B1B6|nr:Rpn family recombination-promoting nuclease/putative transposase [Faecalibacillus faecis]
MIVLVKNYLEMKDALQIFVIMLFFQGRQIIQPEELVSRENDLSTLIGKVDKPTEIKRYRDVVRKASIHGDYVIIGVEHQSTFDEKMIFRILNYDATIYINQVESKQEVYPVGSFVFYTGDKEWKSPETLKNIPSEMEPYINDWRLPVVELKTMDARKLTNQRLKEIVEISQSMFAGNYDDLRNDRKIETENFMMAATFTRTKIKREELPEGDEINLCEAMDRLFQKLRNEGEVLGLEKGETIGYEKGKREEKQNTLKEQLKEKLGTLSSPLEKQLTNTSLEKLNELTLNIFNVTNEEDVLKIIN